MVNTAWFCSYIGGPSYGEEWCRLLREVQSVELTVVGRQRRTDDMPRYLTIGLLTHQTGKSRGGGADRGSGRGRGLAAARI